MTTEPLAHDPERLQSTIDLFSALTRALTDDPTAAQFLVLEKHLSRAALLSSCRFSSEFCPCFDVDRFKHDALTTSGPAILQEFMLGSVLELSDKGVRAEDILAYLSHASDYVSRLVDTTSRMYLREHASPN